MLMKWSPVLTYYFNTAAVYFRNIYLCIGDILVIINNSGTNNFIQDQT